MKYSEPEWPSFLTESPLKMLFSSINRLGTLFCSLLRLSSVSSFSCIHPWPFHIFLGIFFSFFFFGLFVFGLNWLFPWIWQVDLLACAEASVRVEPSFNDGIAPSSWLGCRIYWLGLLGLEVRVRNWPIGTSWNQLEPVGGSWSRWEPIGVDWSRRDLMDGRRRCVRTDIRVMLPLGQRMDAMAGSEVAPSTERPLIALTGRPGHWRPAIGGWWAASTARAAPGSSHSAATIIHHRFGSIPYIYFNI